MSATLREDLQELYALQQIDSKIQRAKKTQSGLDNGTQAQEQLTHMNHDAQQKRGELHRLSGELKDSELKLSSVETKRKNYQQKLYQGTVTNAKELANFEKEIGALGRQQSDLDGKILELMDQVEQQTHDVAAAEANVGEAQKNWESVVSAFRAKYESLNLELSELRRQREDALILVEDKALLKRYEDIRVKSAGLGIVKIEGNDCGGCHMTLPGSTIKAVKEGQTLQTCDNCKRILTA